MQKRNIVIINVYRPPDRPTEKFSSPLNKLRTKRIVIGKSNAKHYINRRPELSNY